MKIMVLGATGFIGRPIAETAIARGHEVLAVHRGRHDPDSTLPCEHLRLDRRDLGRAAAQVRAFGAEASIDAYALTRADAQTALPSLPDGPRIVLSSVDVYEAYDSFRSGLVTEPVPIDESAPTRTKRYPYRGQGMDMDDYEKLDVEQEYLGAGGTVLRLAMIFGERDRQRREEFVLRRVRAGRRAIPVGPGNWLFSRCYVRDVASAALAAAESPDVSGEIFNISDARCPTIEAWMREILAAVAAETELVRVPDDRVPEDLELTRAYAQHLLSDSSKAREVLAWRTSPPEDTVAASTAWHMEHPPPDSSPDFTADDAALAGADRA